MPNPFAYVVLFSWPVVVLVLFRALPLSKALIWSILGGYLVLPTATGLKIPMLPILDKSLVPTISALVLCLIFAPRGRPAALAEIRKPVTQRSPGRSLVFVLLAILFVAPFLSAIQNPEPVIVGPRFIQALTLYDAFSMLSSILVSILPFFLGWVFLSTRESHVHLLQAFVFGALVYSLPVLFELRMSPQLHNWIYGFFPHAFNQHVRAAGFRPVVFLGHGLMMGMLFSLAVLAALTLWREALREGRTSSGWIFAIVWLAGVLSYSRNFGALVITIILGLIIVFTRRRIHVLVAVVIAAIVMLYPMLRGTGLAPVETVYDIALWLNEDRAWSLRFRLDNENALLLRANEKPWFGWGSWGRNHLYEPVEGKMVSVTDGLWVILIGQYGWTGYLAHFGLLILPILFYFRRSAELGPSLVTPGLMLMLGATLLDLLPNAGLVPYVWLMAGAITGFAFRQPATKPSPDEPWLVSAFGWPKRRSATASASWVMQGQELEAGSRDR